MKQENYIRGMIMIILSAFFFACMNVSVRLAGDLPSVQKSFFRNLVAAFFAAIILIKNHTAPKVEKTQWGSLFLRCAFGTLGILCNFYAIDHLLDLVKERENDEKEMDFTYDVCVHFRTWRMWKTDSYRKS